MLERAGVARAIGDVLGVVGVHEDVGAGLQLVPDAAGAFEFERARSRTTDGAAGKARFVEEAQGFGGRIGGGGNGRAPLLRRAQMLGGAVIGLQAAEREKARTRYLSRQPGRR